MLRSAFMWLVAFGFAFAAGALFLSYALLKIDDMRRQAHKPVSEYRQPPAGPAPGMPAPGYEYDSPRDTER